MTCFWCLVVGYTLDVCNSLPPSILRLQKFEPIKATSDITKQEFSFEYRRGLVKEGSIGDWEEGAPNKAAMESISKISSMLDTGLELLLDDSFSADSGRSTRIDVGGSSFCWFRKDCQFSSFG